MKIEIDAVEFAALKTKAELWDKLGSEIGKFYETYGEDGDGEEEPPEREGDLTTIGEVAASAFGYL